MSTIEANLTPGALYTANSDMPVEEIYPGIFSHITEVAQSPVNMTSFLHPGQAAAVHSPANINGMPVWSSAPGRVWFPNNWLLQSSDKSVIKRTPSELFFLHPNGIITHLTITDKLTIELEEKCYFSYQPEQNQTLPVESEMCRFSSPKMTLPFNDPERVDALRDFFFSYDMSLLLHCDLSQETVTDIANRLIPGQIDSSNPLYTMIMDLRGIWHEIDKNAPVHQAFDFINEESHPGELLKKEGDNKIFIRSRDRLWHQIKVELPELEPFGFIA